MLNCLQEDNLFLDKIVLSEEATFHLSGKVNCHNLIIWGSQKSCQVAEVPRKMARSWIVNTIALVDVTFLDKLWDKLDYHLDVCRITRGSNTEHL
jgi:hypothetical protein